MPDSPIFKRIREQFEADIYASCFGQTSTVAAAPQEPLTLDKLRRLMCSMPPRETWLSSKIFPSNSAFTVKGSGENFTCAHPDFWRRLACELRRAAKPATTPPMLGMTVTPTEIDACPDDSEDTAKWRAAHWARLREAVEVAFAYADLPECLKTAPAFTSHG